MSTDNEYITTGDPHTSGAIERISIWVMDVDGSEQLPAMRLPEINAWVPLMTSHTVPGEAERMQELADDYAKQSGNTMRRVDFVRERDGQDEHS